MVSDVVSAEKSVKIDGNIFELERHWNSHLKQKNQFQHDKTRQPK